jgi:pyruvate dehydrogenase E2 component (dihydrolipoamide acetyltransferase)
MATEVKLPELGENIEEGDVVSVLVAAGDSVEKDQALLELETGKATVEVPSPVAGVVASLLVSEGDKVKVGQPILTMASEDAVAAEEPPEEVSSGEEAPEEKPAEEEPAKETPSGEETPVEPSADTAPPPSAPAPDTSVPSEGVPVAAAPSVRKFAREIGVEIAAVRGTGGGGRITLDDVKAHAKQALQGGGGGPARAAVALPDFSTWGEVRREKMSTIRRLTAEHMDRCWSTIPHVTQHGDADITRIEAFRKKYGKMVEREGAKLTPTAILVKLVAGALKAFPNLNASVDAANGEIVYKDYIHIGVAVDTPKGLVVPVIRNADQKGIIALAKELGEMAEKARDGKISPDQLQGGTFTVSNLGGIGGTYFTPIVNHPEVGILGVGRARVQPVWEGEAFEPRQIMPLSLSYDHRLIDGAEGARFLRWLTEAIEDALVLALEG